MPQALPIWQVRGQKAPHIPQREKQSGITIIRLQKYGPP